MNQLEILIGEMTIADLARISGKSVAEIAAYVLGGGPVPKSTNSTSKGAPAATNGTPKAAATAKLAADIIAALEKSDTPLRSMDLEKLVGGTTETRRHVLAQLLAEKKIRKSGVARGTRYAVR
jgi:hypothetical protein